MTADALFDRVLTLIFSDRTDKGDLEESYLSCLNLVLAECFDQENAMRERDGLEPLESPPVLSSTEQEIDYHWRLLAVIPYGVAGLLYAEDEEGLAAGYKNKYEAERAALVWARTEPVEDFYG